MAATAKQTRKLPEKAQGFYSFTVTIDDDDAYSFTPPGGVGFAFFATTGSSNYGTVWYRTTANAKLNSGANFAVTTGALTGTTGVDGQVTFSVDSGVHYLENRLGVQAEWTVIYLCSNDGVD